MIAKTFLHLKGFKQPAAVLHSFGLFVGFRLDRYRGDPKEEHKDCFDFECHIYVDDAFMIETDTETKYVNSYVRDITQVVTEVYRYGFQSVISEQTDVEDVYFTIHL